ncbi:hypothetical protein IWW51_005117 [Coemansia sp. RSA 2702]|nr:hypothetical protein IWW51_005117 [Coemansia sp. RSA 2702]
MDAPLVGLPCEPYNQHHAMTLRYMRRRLVDDIAGEEAADDGSVCVSDLPAPARVIRPGMRLPAGLAFPSNTLVVVVDHDNIITFVGAP